MNYSKLSRLMAVAGVGALTLSSLNGANLPPSRAPQAHGAAKVRGMRRGAMMWRVFSQLSDAERKKIQELQRSNPEAFAETMKKLVDKYEQQERARIRRLSSLIRKYRQSTDTAERGKLKAEVVKMEKERFEHRLKGLERTIEGTKRRLIFMEQELNKRKAKKEAIVEARAEALLSGELPVAFPIHPHRGAPPVRPQRKAIKH